ncbi:hypothetical protein V6N11_036761 [Hibiscus sabdariffa]|uniref:Uncharacterized protein n=1 Tax=Hibiscus sabdariffa TaxID=183260 RepID=A0ABR2RBD3_9ROSI
MVANHSEEEVTKVRTETGDATRDVTEEATVDVPRGATGNVTEEATVDVPGDATEVACEDATSDLHEEATANVKRPTSSPSEISPFVFIPTPGLASHPTTQQSCPTQQPGSVMTVRLMPTS